MKKILSAALVGALAIGFISAGGLKAAADVIERGFVSVSTTANTELPPDVVEISIAVQPKTQNPCKKLLPKIN